MEVNQSSVRTKAQLEAEPNLCEDQGSLRTGGIPERGLEPCFTEDSTVASPRTELGPSAGRSCAAVLSGARPQCGRSWVSLRTGAELHGGAEPGLS